VCRLGLAPLPSSIRPRRGAQLGIDAGPVRLCVLPAILTNAGWPGRFRPAIVDTSAFGPLSGRGLHGLQMLMPRLSGRNGGCASSQGAVLRQAMDRDGVSCKCAAEMTAGGERRSTSPAILGCVAAGCARPLSTGWLARLVAGSVWHALACALTLVARPDIAPFAHQAT